MDKNEDCRILWIGYLHSVAKIPYSQLYGGRQVEGPFTLEEYINQFLVSEGAGEEKFTLREPPCIGSKL